MTTTDPPTNTVASQLHLNHVDMPCACARGAYLQTAASQSDIVRHDAVLAFTQNGAAFFFSRHPGTHMNTPSIR